MSTRNAINHHPRNLSAEQRCMLLAEVIRAFRGKGAEAAMSTATSLAGAMVEGVAIIRRNDVAERALFVGGPAASGGRNLPHEARIPLYVDDELWGILEVKSGPRVTLGPEDHRTLRAVAGVLEFAAAGRQEKTDRETTTVRVG